MNTFDPSKYKILTSAEYEVTDARGDIIFLDEAGEKPWTITVASPGTKKAIKAKFEYEKAINADLLAQTKGKKPALNEEAKAELRVDFLMKITEGTNADNLVYDGQSGMDALRAIYSDPFMDHVTSGVDTFHFKLGNFAPGSKTVSSSTSDSQPG